MHFQYLDNLTKQVPQLARRGSGIDDPGSLDVRLVHAVDPIRDSHRREVLPAQDFVDLISDLVLFLGRFGLVQIGGE